MTVTMYERLTREFARKWKDVESRRYTDELPPCWINDVVKPLADQISRDVRLVHLVCKVSGPFGLCNNVNVTWSRSNQKHGDDWWEMQFRPLIPESGTFGISDLDTWTGDYKAGTVGWYAGMNHPTLMIPTRASLRWFRERVTYHDGQAA